ncbi:MAG: bifunctional nuclease family protein [Tannerellaceae bacterium]|nr:bifunctional nuclease family protein [Tannerellaceae bacterium]
MKLRVQGLTNSQIQSGTYALILAEEDGLRRIPIIVGTAEAQSIAIALEQIIPPRPLTHDLFTVFSQAFHIELLELYIYKFEDGFYYSALVFNNGEQEVRLDSRTSDAIAIALRVGCSIYTTEEIMRECGVVLDDSVFSEEERDDEPENNDFAEDLEPEDMENEEQLHKWLRLLDKDEIQRRKEEGDMN